MAQNLTTFELSCRKLSYVILFLWLFISLIFRENISFETWVKFNIFTVSPIFCYGYMAWTATGVILGVVASLHGALHIVCPVLICLPGCLDMGG